MVLRFQDNQGIQALDTNQIIELVRGNSIVNIGNRFNVTVDTGNLGQGDTLQVESGTALVGGSEASNNSSQSVQIDAADADNPRKDVVFIDSNGAAQVAKGTPEDPEPEGAQRFDLFQPAPPARNDVDGAVVAEVFVGAGSNSVSKSDLRDRRLFGDAELASLNLRSGYSPSSPGDAATKDYVDTEVTDSQIDVQDDGTSVLADAEALNFKGGHFAASDDAGGVAGVDISTGSLENTLLVNSSVTVNAGDGLKSGGSVSLGGSVVLDVEPADFAGSFVSDDGNDNLSVDIGTGLAGDGSGNIAVDEAGVNHDSLQGFVSNEHVDHSAVSVTGTGALTGGGDLTSSRSIDVAVSAIGTSEVDESANFSFSNLGATTVTGDLDMSDNSIDDVASIDGGGSAILVGDTVDMQDNIINNARFVQNLDGNLDLKAGDGSFLFINNGVNASTIISNVDGSGNPTRRLEITSGTAQESVIVKNASLNMANSDSIQDSGTDAIQFNGSGVATFPNNVKLNGFNVQHTANRSWFFDQETNNSMLMRNLGGGDFVVQTTNASGGSTDRLRLNGGVDTAEVNIENANLDLNANSINNVNNIDKADSTGIFQFADPTNGAILHLNKDTTVDVQPNTTQPGSSTNPSLGLGDSGAGFFINSSGEIVAVDEAGNTTTIS